MKGLVIWAHSNCRSMMGVYAALVKALKCPVVIALWESPVAGCQGLRDRVGFSSSEFSEIEMLSVGENWLAGKKILDEHPGYNHLFGVYQKSPNFRRLIREAARRGERVGVLSEAPCNMIPGWRGLLKKFIYLPFVLPWKIRSVVASADFVLSLSGEYSTRALERIGWPKNKIIPFGYFPPPIPGSKFVKRETTDDFHLLVTGIMTWHRGQDVVLDALSILKKRGARVRATITQEGPLAAGLKRRAQTERLDVTFPGFLPMKDLIHLYETCSAYVAAGRAEPWGMRLNDAVHCGAPLIVSRGMGGVQIVDRFACGLSFENESPADLADKIENMMSNKEDYRRIAGNVQKTSEALLPESQAQVLREKLSCFSAEWM